MVLLDRLRAYPRIATSVGSMYSGLATVYSYINGKHDPRGLTRIWSLHSSYNYLEILPSTWPCGLTRLAALPATFGHVCYAVMCSDVRGASGHAKKRLMPHDST